jgi:acetate kinase
MGVPHERILVFNPGSSSLKFALFALATDPPGRALRRVLSGTVAPLRGASRFVGQQNESLAGASRFVGAATPEEAREAQLQLDLPGEEPRVAPSAAHTPVEAAASLMSELEALVPGALGDLRAAGCRVVHGGARLTAPALVTPEVLEILKAVEPLAPLHNPIDVAVLETLGRALPGLPTVAVFDTAFHASLPEVARTYALPADVCARHGLRRFGFHGISHAYVSRQLLERLGRRPEGTRLVTLHLGNGASACALRDGVSVDTSMGMTPLEGLVMGTRAGDVDPGLVLFLVRTEGLAPGRLHELLNAESGLLGVSGVSSDLRAVEHAAASGDARAELALALFAYRARKTVGAYAAALGGLDGIAFAGGIGEHSATTRARICAGLEFLGVRLDEERNVAATGDREAAISAEDAPVAVWVIPTDEELEIARATAVAVGLR